VDEIEKAMAVGLLSAFSKETHGTRRTRICRWQLAADVL